MFFFIFLSFEERRVEKVNNPSLFRQTNTYDFCPITRLGLQVFMFSERKIISPRQRDIERIRTRITSLTPFGHLFD